MELNREDYNQIKEIIYDKSGMALRGDKYDFISRRVTIRMRAMDIHSTRDYCRYLMFDPDGKELAELTNLIVIGETYFFREFDYLRLFGEEVLPLIVEKKEKSSKKQLKVLSAGCATGEEPYTLAIIIKEMLDQPELWNIRIDGLDINYQAIEKGQEGCYSDHALRETPYVYRDTYFRSKNSMYVIKPEIRQLVSLSWGNLYDSARMSRMSGYDVVFCRNVLIYFDRKSAAKVLENLYRVMKQGSYIFSGMAESIGRLTTLFQMERFNKAFVYQK